MRSHKKIVIIGGGPCGLSAAWHLKQLGCDNFVLCERNAYLGGLCASFRDRKGFFWDLGGHVFFSKEPYFYRLLKKIAKNDLLKHQRSAWIRFRGTWVPYPFQDHLECLPKNIAAKCKAGLAASKSSKNASLDFRSWILSHLGTGIAEYFMFPLNQKVWKYDLSSLGAYWIEDRVSTAKVAKRTWGTNHHFLYPRYAGAGAWFEQMALKFTDKLELNSEVVRIDPEKKTVFLSNGKKNTYDVLISTMPLDLLVKRIFRERKDLLMASRELKHNSMFVAGIGVKGPSACKKHWMYFPEKHIPFSRVTYLSNYSPDNVPDRKKYHSLLCEIPYSEQKKENKHSILSKTVLGLVKVGLLDHRGARSVVSKFLFDIKYAYPIPTLTRDKEVNKIILELERYDIYSRGRFGTWKYEIGNTDHALLQGKEIADRIVTGKKETVFVL